MPRRKYGKRGLSAEERELWQKVVEKTTPIRATNPVFLSVNPPPKPRSFPVAQPLAPFRVGQATRGLPPTHILLPDLDQRFSSVSPNMDRRNFERLKKGKLAIDGRVDLHGMTQDQAYPALISFVKSSHTKGRRLLLVITGKGKTSHDEGIMPVRRGVLKHLVPQWLTLPPVAPLVLQVTQASRKHGGSGAYYVYLRRVR